MGIKTGPKKRLNQQGNLIDDSEIIRKHQEIPLR